MSLIVTDKFLLEFSKQHGNSDRLEKVADTLSHDEYGSCAYYRPAVPAHKIGLLEKHYTPPYNSQRRAKLILFIFVFLQHDKFKNMTKDEKFALVERIERACFNYTIKKSMELNIPTKWDCDLFSDTYTIICAKISSNIDQTDDVKNPYLAGAILDGKINIQDLPRMTSQELDPDRYANVLQRIEVAKNIKQTVKTTSMYRCRRCHKTECISEPRYNRSLDEGINSTVHCVSCGNSWNVSG